MKKVMFTFVMFVILLVSCPHKTEIETGPNKKPLPPANPILKGTTWEDANKQTISFSDSVGLAIIQSKLEEYGAVIEAPYEVKDEKVIISLDDFIYKLENFGEKDFVEGFKTMLVSTMIKELKDVVNDPTTDSGIKAKVQARIDKLESGLGYLTSKAGLKKYLREILIPVQIEQTEELIADPKIPDTEKNKMKKELEEMKEALDTPFMLDAMLEAQYIVLKESINDALPDIKKSNPITLKCEEDKTLETTGKLISSTFVVHLEFVAPINIQEDDEFVKKQ